MGNAGGAPTASATVASTADPAFATNSGGRILAWNDAARRFLGFEASQVLGRRCYNQLAGRDIFGNRYCHSDCPLIGMAKRHEAVGHFEVYLRSASGEMLLTGVNVVLVPGDGPVERRCMVHILYPVAQPTGFDSSVHDPLPDGDRLGRLTPREAEVLDLLAQGKSTREVAELLFLSVATVRNHVQSILRKLRVHSRLGAVAELHNGRAV